MPPTPPHQLIMGSRYKAIRRSHPGHQNQYDLAQGMRYIGQNQQGMPQFSAGQGIMSSSDPAVFDFYLNGSPLPPRSGAGGVPQAANVGSRANLGGRRRKTRKTKKGRKSTRRH